MVVIVGLIDCREHAPERDFEHVVEVGRGRREGLVHCLCDVVDETPLSVRAVHIIAYLSRYAVIDDDEAREESDNERAKGKRFGYAFSGDHNIVSAGSSTR